MFWDIENRARKPRQNQNTQHLHRPQLRCSGFWRLEGCLPNQVERIGEFRHQAVIRRRTWMLVHRVIDVHASFGVPIHLAQHYDRQVSSVFEYKKYYGQRALYIKDACGTHSFDEAIAREGRESSSRDVYAYPCTYVYTHTDVHIHIGINILSIFTFNAPDTLNPPNPTGWPSH